MSRRLHRYQVPATPGPFPVRIGRRRALKLAGLAGFACVFGGVAQAASQRVVVLDWGAAETMIAMGNKPLGLAELPAYDQVVGPTERAGSDIVDVGLRLAPNAEALHALQPSLIVINSAQIYMRSSLERFAPVHVFEIYGTEGEPYAMAEQATTELGDALGAADAASELKGRVRSELATTRQRLSGRPQRPLFVIQLQDQRHAAVFGKGSLIQAVLDQIGIANAWQGTADFWGLSVVGLEAFAATPDADMVYFALPQVDVAAIRASVFWQNLPPVRTGSAIALPPLWAYGGLPSANRIGVVLADALMESRG
ncbi:MAG: ABC transporter substrate-binding protein [Rhizobiaceae bacterium]|nr:ABC transporter substrate-binding protein [Rhizobiaceae bacterium]